MSITDYRGMSYQNASREGSRLIEEATETGRWFALPEKLKQLREIMMRNIERGTVNSEPPRCRKSPQDLRKIVALLDLRQPQ